MGTGGALEKKCESVFQTADQLAKQSGFTLVGEMYGTSLQFQCNKLANDIHLNNIAITRTLPKTLRCLKCSKLARAAEKADIQEEQRRQHALYT